MTTRISSNLVRTFGSNGIATLGSVPIFSSNVVSNSYLVGNLLLINQDARIGGNLVVQGNITTIGSENFTVADSIITLNSNVTGSPSEDAGIEVNRGSSPSVSLRWNETTDSWQLTNDGINYNNVGTVSTGKAIAMSIVFGG